MNPTIPKMLRPAAAGVLTSVPTSGRLVALSRLPASKELAAFLGAIHRMGADDPTACEHWTAHDLVAHLAAGSQEMARLLTLRLERGPDADVGPTRAFEEREAPFRAMPDGQLRRRFLMEAFELTDLLMKLQAAGQHITVTFTGWDMTASELILHGRSELAIHRWDLVGTDAVSRELLGAPDLFNHGVTVLARTGIVVDSRPTNESDEDHERLLALWGRDPAGRR